MWWLQELGSHEIIPDQIETEMDVLENIGTGSVYLGAVNHHGLFAPSHTLVLWWNPQQFHRGPDFLMQKITGLERPGASKTAVLWTTNPIHSLSIEDPLQLDIVSSRQVFAMVHLLHKASDFPQTPPRTRQLWYQLDSIVDTVLEMTGPRLLKSLRDADLYRAYREDLIREKSIQKI